MKNVILCLMALLLSSAIFSQNSFKTKRLTYLWDVTLSMKGHEERTPDIYDAVVNVMVQDINAIADEKTEIVVVPFQDKVCDIWREKATAMGKKNIIAKIRNYDNTKVTNTCISQPLQCAIDNIFTADCIDIMKLMTDGIDNVNPARLQQVLKNWCAMAQSKDVYGYYILLTDFAHNDNLSLILKEICRFEEVDANGNLSAINDIVQITSRFSDGISLNIRHEYNTPKRLDFIQYMGDTPPTGFKIHFRTRPNPYVSVDEVVEMRSDNSVEIHPRFLMSQDSLKSLLPALFSDGNLILDYNPASTMETGSFAFTRLLDDHCPLFLINKPEKTVHIHIKSKSEK